MFKRWFQGQAVDCVGVIGELAGDGSGNCSADEFAHLLHVFDSPGEVSHRFQNGDHVSDGDSLAEEVLEDFLDIPGADSGGFKFGNDGRVESFGVVDELGGFLARKKLGGVGFDDFGEVGGHHGGGFHNRVAVSFGHFSLSGFDPEGREVEYWFIRGGSGDGLDHGSGINGEVFVGECGGGGDGLATDFYDIFVGLEDGIVADSYGGHHVAKFRRDLAACCADTFAEISASADIGELGEGVSDFDFDGVDSDQGHHLLGSGWEFRF